MNWTQIRFVLLSKRMIGRILVFAFYGKLSRYTSARWGGGGFDSEIERQLENFRPNCKFGWLRLRIIKSDIIWSYYRYGSTPDEYFLFDFPHCSVSRRGQFLTTKHKDDMMKRHVGFGEGWQMLENKYNFYQRFRKFFRRDVLLMNYETGESDFVDFVSKHSSVMVKPIDGQCGRGIVRKNLVEFGGDAHKMYKDIKQNGYACMIEEIIDQCDELAAINATSVNTVRLPTFMNRNGFHVLKPFIRMGRKGSVVDNANGGGIFCVVDEATGRLLTNGMDKHGNTYPLHPDSHHKLKGWVVPRWEELIELAKQIHNTIPSYPYVGWDFALSRHGWVLVEGNWGQFVSEYADREGIKSRFDSMFDDIEPLSENLI